MNKNTICVIVILILSNAGNLLSQEFNFSDKEEPAVTINNNSILTGTPQNIQSKEELQIIDEMNLLKSDQDHMNGEKILQLQKKLESINHRSITKSKDQTSFKLFSDEAIRNHIQNQTDVISKSEFYSASSAYIKSIATQTEQRAGGSGTVWVSVAIGGGDGGVGASPDTLLLFKSVDNGSTYNLYSKLPLNVGNKINYDDMDMEIIEASSTIKYIHLVFGYITDGFTGAYRTGVVSYNIINNTVGNEAILTFPGYTYSGNKYSRPRITSDNAYYSSGSYVTIAVTQDSSDGVNDYFMTKFCRMYNPFSINPSITYMPKSIYTPFTGFSNTAQTDIAYYNSGGVSSGDSIIFVVSGTPGFLNLILTYKANGNASVYPVQSTFLFQNFHDIESARIASNGGSNQKKMIIVFAENFTDNGIDISNLYVYKTNDANSWSKSLLAGGGYIFKAKYPDIIGRRNTEGKFYITNKWDTPLTDIISSYVFDNMISSSLILNHNNSNYKSYSAPKPSFRFVNNDSCLTFWPTYTSVYSSIGCNVLGVGARFNIQGLYDPATNTTKFDYSIVYLRQAMPPYAKIDSAIGYNMSFFTFHNAVPGLYYLAVNNRNSIETWSNVPLNFSYLTSLDFNFYLLASKAYGSNQVQVDNSPVTFAIYSGDINQDGTIDASDLSGVENDAAVSLSGYVATDLNGDDFVDASDLSIVENNASLGVSAITP